MSNPTYPKNIVNKIPGGGGSGGIEISDTNTLRLTEDSVLYDGTTLTTYDGADITFADGIDVIYPNRNAVHESQLAGNQAISTSTYTKVLFDDSEIRATGGSYLFENSRFTNLSGVSKVYHVRVFTHTENQSSGEKRIHICPKNTLATADQATLPFVIPAVYNPATSSSTDRAIIDGFIQLDDKDWFEVSFLQTSGLTKNINFSQAGRYDLFSAIIIAEI